MTVGGVGGPLGVQGVLALRARILEQGAAIRAAAPAAGPVGADAARPAAVGGFGAAMAKAVHATNELQAQSGAQSAAYERGETHDIAAVMLARQKSSVAFEATVQVRNRLLSAYRDIMNMPV